MGRTNKINVYVSDSDLSRLEREAEDADMSLSGYCMSLIERQWHAQDTEAVADQLAVEEKVERIVADAREELLGIARSVEQRNNDVADMTARAGSYSIANFELLKDEFDPAEARKAEALLTGSRRLREPITEHPDRDLDLDLDEDGDGEDKERSKGEQFFTDHDPEDVPDPDELDEYGLHPDDQYYDIKRKEAEVHEAIEREEEEGGLHGLFATSNRSPPTEREAEYLQEIPEDERTDYQERRLTEFRRNKREWEAKRDRIHLKARRKHEKRKEEQNSGLSGLFRS